MAASAVRTHNLGETSIRSYRWAGIDIRTIEQTLLPGRSWQSIDSDRPTLSIVTRQVDGHCEPRFELDRSLSLERSERHAPAGHINLIPAGTCVYGYTEQMSALTETRLSLDPTALSHAMGGHFPGHGLDEPRLMFFDPALLRLGHLAAAHCADDPTLLADSVALAVVARLAALFSSRPLEEVTNGLSKPQLKAVVEFIMENMSRSIRLTELSDLVDLSPSQFGRSFKTSTGASPHRWHLNARVERAKDLLEQTKRSLVDIALALGFSEQSHLCRVFKSVTGEAPGQWRKARK